MTTVAQDTTNLPRAEPQAGCFVCGQGHPHGLRIRYELGSDGAAVARWIPTIEWQGFRGVIHGGIVSTVLDEAMSKAVAAAHGAAVTGELRVRFRHPVAPGEELYIRGWIVERKKRLVAAAATLTSSDGSRRAHASAAFLLLSKTGR